MLFVKRVWGLFTANWKTALFFEAVFKAVLISILLPLCKGLCGFAVYLYGSSYLTQDTIGGFLASPVTWVVIVLVALIIAVALLFELCSLAILFRADKTGEVLSLSTLCHLSMLQVRRINKRRNFLFIPFILMFATVANAGLIIGSAAFAPTSSFIGSYFAVHPGWLAFFILLAAVLIGTSCAFVFSLFYFTLVGKGFFDACMASLRLIKGNIAYLLARLAVWNLILAVMTALLALLLRLLSRYLLPLVFAVLPVPASAVAMQLTIVCIVLFVAYSCFAVTITYALVSQMYFDLLEKRGAKLPTPVFALHVTKERVEGTRTTLKTVATLSALLVCLIVALEVQESVIDSRVEAYASCEVTANGGYSRVAPENTLEAFQAAIGAGADCISLDVWQTQDDVLIVLGDSNLKQATGLDGNIWEVSYDQIKDLDNGSWFDPAFSGSRICTLEQVLDLCAGKAEVCVRIEPDGHGAGIEEKVAALADAKGMTLQTIVSSGDLGVLERVKAVDPAMRTMYELQVVYGDISNIAHVDIYNVEQAFVTPDMVDEVHAAGKYLSTGLVNNPSVMVVMIGYNVDALVTDDIPAARELAY